MKILITADWHIGKRLHNEDLSQDMNLFFEWLLDQIKFNDVVVAGVVLIEYELALALAAHVTVTLDRLAMVMLVMDDTAAAGVT
jgi:exonuclease SbcD